MHLRPIGTEIPVGVEQFVPPIREFPRTYRAIELQVLIAVVIRRVQSGTPARSGALDHLRAVVTVKPAVDRAMNQQREPKDRYVDSLS